MHILKQVYHNMLCNIFDVNIFKKLNFCISWMNSHQKQQIIPTVDLKCNLKVEKEKRMKNNSEKKIKTVKSNFKGVCKNRCIFWSIVPILEIY